MEAEDDSLTGQTRQGGAPPPYGGDNYDAYAPYIWDAGGPVRGAPYIWGAIQTNSDSTHEPTPPKGGGAPIPLSKKLRTKFSGRPYIHRAVLEATRRLGDRREY
jgi:hypothetical protein